MNRYRKGANLERELVNKYRAKGDYAARFASSKSGNLGADVILVCPNGGFGLLVQCKATTKVVPKDEIEKLKKAVVAFASVKGWDAAICRKAKGKFTLTFLGK